MFGNGELINSSGGLSTGRGGGDGLGVCNIEVFISKVKVWWSLILEQFMQGEDSVEVIYGEGFIVNWVYNIK